MTGDPREQSAAARASVEREGPHSRDSAQAATSDEFVVASDGNPFRLLVIGICTNHPGVPPEYSSVIISLGLACFTLPYLLLAAPAGYCADRLSKQHVIVGCKIAEIFIMA